MMTRSTNKKSPSPNQSGEKSPAAKQSEDKSPSAKQNGEKTQSSIHTSAGNEKTLLETINAKMDELKTEFLRTLSQEIRVAIQPLQEKLASTVDCLENTLKDIEDLEKENGELRKIVNDLATQIEKSKRNETILNSKLADLQEKQLASDTYSKKENLIFHGIPQTEEACQVALRAFLKDTLKITENDVKTMIFQRCHRLNTKLKPQPIICRFAFFSDRMKIWNARMKLKGTNYSINEDFPPEIQSRRKLLYPVMKAARADNRKAYLNGQTLEIDGKPYNVNNLHTLPEKFNPANLATVQKNNITAFFSRSSPLSNFYPVDLRIDDHCYSTTEQYYQEQRALFGVKPDIAQKIRSTVDPAQCKKLGESVPVTDQEWMPRAIQVMKKACYAKFVQNPLAKICLLRTGDTEIAEAGPDRTWGVRRKLNDSKVHIKNEWIGQNHLGTILMDIRKDLSK